MLPTLLINTSIFYAHNLVRCAIQKRFGKFFSSVQPRFHGQTRNGFLLINFTQHEIQNGRDKPAGQADEVNLDVGAAEEFLGVFGKRQNALVFQPSNPNKTEVATCRLGIADIPRPLSRPPRL